MSSKPPGINRPGCECYYFKIRGIYKKTFFFCINIFKLDQRVERKKAIQWDGSPQKILQGWNHPCRVMYLALKDPAKKALVLSMLPVIRWLGGFN
jgi:hypothetical protein